jgi:citrate lyase subunit beta/citryl-CoA lyase
VHAVEIDIINEILSPSADEVARAQQVIEWAQQATDQGAANVIDDDGHTVGPAVVRAARRLLGLPV